MMKQCMTLSWSITGMWYLSILLSCAFYADADSITVTITQQDGPGAIEEQNGQKQLVLNPGDSLALRCEVLGEPSASGVLWKTTNGNGDYGISFNERVLTRDERYSIVYQQENAALTSILRIEALTLTDTANFACQAIGSSSSDAVQLLVLTRTCDSQSCQFGGVCEAGRCVCPQCDESSESSESGPVCGSDYMTYDNECLMEKNSCLQQEQLSLVYDGPCDSPNCFKCQHSEICLPLYSQCDGFEDCADGSDEDQELCQKTGVTPEPPLSCDIKCEEITDPLCHYQVYTYTGFPNIMGHTQQGHIQQYDHLVEMLQDCYNHSIEFLCGILTPHCVEDRGLMLPTRKMCEEFHAGCDEFIVEAAETFKFDCNRLPERSDAPPHCLHFPTPPPDAIPTVPAEFKPTAPAVRYCRHRNEGSSNRCSVLMLFVATLSAIIAVIAQQTY